MRIGLRHGGDGRFFAIPDLDETLVGQAETCRIVLDDMGVGAQHARIRISALGIEIDDLGTPQGTLVNSYSIAKHFLSCEDEVRLGNASLVVELDKRAGPPVPRCQRCGADVASVDPARVPGSGYQCAPCAARPDRRGSTGRFRVVKPSGTMPAKPDPIQPIDASAGTPTRRYQRSAITERLAKIPPMIQAAPSAAESSSGGSLDRELIPDYVPIHVLGEGSQGRVYKLRHKTTGEIVAGKLLTPAGSKAQSRLDREVEALKRLKHPAIVGLLDVRALHGSTLLIMEHVEGPTLATLTKRFGSIAPLRALSLAARLADGLAYAATRNVVHRDIKPSNILVGPGDSPKLVDFGLVAFGDVDRSRLTSEGQWIGTPHYMAPEQMTGDATDSRTDVWGLGVTFYHAITGRLPFEARMPVELFKKILNDPIDLDPFEALAGPSARELFGRILSKRPEDRPAPLALAAELANLAKR